MLRELLIRNFALIDEAHIQFGPSFNVFTGATGVGKSLIIGALNLLLGGRAATDAIRSGAAEASVDGVFEVPDAGLRREAALVSGVDLADAEVVVRRIVDAGGRSRCSLNGKPITVTMLREIGEMLVAIHGQHEHECLLHAPNQLLLLDRFADATALRNAFSELLSEVNELRARRRSLTEGREARRRQAELLRFQIEEIDGTKLRPGEDEELERERRVLANAEKIRAAVTSAYDALYESEQSIFVRLKRIAREMGELSGVDESLKAIAEGCEKGLAEMEEAAFALRERAQRTDADPRRLAQADERLEQIRSLKKKYGATISEVLDSRGRAAEELGRQTSLDQELAETDRCLAEKTAALERAGNELSARRQAAAKRLSGLVEKELMDLGMANTRFEALVTPRPAPQDGASPADRATAGGFDEIEFMVAPNVGEELMPLKKIASGGEISRIMLALKSCLAEADRMPVLIFDEIDANVGGRMGRVIGQKMAAIAQTRQVLCVTHLPQIACFADAQMKVTKEVDKDRTFTRLALLEGEARVDEIAEMIRGEQRTAVTRREAEDMLADARRLCGSSKATADKRR